MKLNKCPACKTKIKEQSNVCPNCGQRFTCKCGKELDDNKYKKCPLCRAEAADTRKKVLSRIGIAVGTTAAVLFTAATIISKIGDKPDEEAE